MGKKFFDNTWMNESKNYHLLVLLFREESAKLTLYENLLTVFREWCGKETGLTEREMRAICTDYIAKVSGCEFALLFTKGNGETRPEFIKRCHNSLLRYKNYANVPGKVQVKNCVYGNGKYGERNKVKEHGKVR